MMHKMRNVKLMESKPRHIVLLTIVLLVSLTTVAAKEHKVKANENEAHVVAHISFGELSAVDMAMQRKVNDKYYLYVQYSKDQGISIIDISRPAQAKALGVISWPHPASSSTMNVTGNLAIIAESESLSMRSVASSKDDLVLWDLSNPAAPRVVQKFTGVVRWLQDERNFVYVLNGEGLWVVSEPADRQPEQIQLSSYGD
jgi:hypothetical protein